MTKKKISIPLKVAVSSRISRESCGVACEELWDKNVHHPEDKKFDPILQEDVSKGVMKWHVRQVSSTGSSINMSYSDGCFRRL